jgi:phytol kinase
LIKSVWIATGLTFILAIFWLRLNDYIAHRGWISSNLSRKIIHMGTGLIFVLCWLFFPDVKLARYLAACIPLAVTIQFFLVGTGVIKDVAAVNAMSRTGDRRDILKGPLFYGIVFIVITIMYWKTTPIGIIALMLLCGGDGLADILGSRLKSAPIPWSKNKSIIGTLAMLTGGWLFAFSVIAIYVARGVFISSIYTHILPIIIISLASTFVESLPFRDIDNITVPLVAVIFGHLLYGFN